MVCFHSAVACCGIVGWGEGGGGGGGGAAGMCVDTDAFIVPAPAGLGEHRLRDLNDEINKLIRIKGHWERRIRELGGQSFRHQSSFLARQGQMPRGARGGYMYFGAAKNLPGVRELFEEVEAPKPKRTRADMYRNVTPDYYGYRDEDDGTLLLLEAEAEAKGEQHTCIVGQQFATSP